MVKNLHQLACKFDRNQSEHKPSKARPNGSASTCRPKFSTCMARLKSKQIHGEFQILVILSTVKLVFFGIFCNLSLLYCS